VSKLMLDGVQNFLVCQISYQIALPSYFSGSGRKSGLNQYKQQSTLQALDMTRILRLYVLETWLGMYRAHLWMFHPKLLVPMSRGVCPFRST